MEGKDEPKRSKKIPAESSKAKEACDLYLSMGADRSIAKVAAQLGHSPGYQRILEDWSRWYGWVLRAEKYDDEQRERRRKRRQQELDKLYDKLAKVCSEELEKTLKDIDKLRKSDKGLGSIASVNLFKIITDMHLHVLGDDDKSQKVELTGKDGGKIEMETVVETFWGRGTDPRKRTEPAEEPSKEDKELAESDDEDPEVSAEFGIEVPEDEEES